MRYRFSCAALAAIMLLSGCASTDIQNDPRNPSDPNSLDLMADLVSGGNSSVNSQTEQNDKTATDVPEGTQAPEIPSGSLPEIAVSGSTEETAEVRDMNNDFDMFYEAVHDKFELTGEELSFVDYSLFVGDSICSGFSEYGIVPHEHVAAKGNLGSRSFFDYTFKYRGWESRTYDQVLKSANPRYVFLSMGMNDVNMVDEATYCENYRKVIEATLEGSRADVFVAAITPVCSKFCGNSVIDSFNNTMKKYLEENFPERVHYFDFGRYLKNEKNELRECLHSGDGVHLGPYAYRIALWEMHRALTEAGLWDGDSATGTFEAENFQPADEVPPVYTTAETTAKTSKPAKTTKPTKPTKPAKPDKTTKPSGTTKEIPVEETPVEVTTQDTKSAATTAPSGTADSAVSPASSDDLIPTEQTEPVELPATSSAEIAE